MEATPGYLYGGQPLASSIRRVSPQAHAVVSLRSPSERCWSWFRFQQSRARLPVSMQFEEYLDRCEQLHRRGVDGEVEHRAFWGLGGGCYDLYLPDWVAEFGDMFKIVFFENLTRGPAATVAELCHWLDIDQHAVRSFDFAVENRTEQYRRKWLQRAAIVANRRSERLANQFPGLKRTLRSAYYGVNGARTAPVEISPAAREHMTAFYRPHNERLEQQLASLGLELPAGWT